MNLGHPARGLAFIKHIDTEERYRGGQIIIPDPVRDKVAAQQFNVVAVGAWERCPEEEEIPDCSDDGDCGRSVHQVLGPIPGSENFEPGRFHFCEVEPGDWVLCRNRSWAATPDPDIFVVKQSDILGKWVEG